MSAELEKAATTIITQSVYDLDQVVFQNSLKEGASELNVLARLLLLRQRVAVDEYAAKAPRWWDRVGRLRSLREAENLARVPNGAVGEELRKWRRDEVLDPPSRINQSHATLACGDIFECSTGGRKQWLFLGQPCDLAVRDDGNRIASQGFFVRIKDNRPDKTKVENRYFQLPYSEGEKQPVLDFIEWGVVNLTCLELVVFNTDGQMALCEGMSPAPLLLPGWKKRFQDTVSTLQRAAAKAQENLKGNPKQPQDPLPERIKRLALTGTITAPEGEFVKPWGVKFSYQRIGRLRQPWTIEALVSFTSYLTRAAFEHDFAKLLPEGAVPSEANTELPVEPKKSA